MYKNLQWKIYTILGLIAVSLWMIFPLKEKINLGLDLQGGMHLVLRVDTSKLPPEARASAPERALEVIRNRVDEFGVKEPSIQLQGTENIVVQLPGVTDRTRALDLLGKTAHLEFKMVVDDAEKLKEAMAGTVPEGCKLNYVDNEPLLLQAQPSLTGDAVVDARVDFDQTAFGQPYVGFSLSPEGARVFARVTRENIGRRLAIILDGKVRSAPRIETEIPSGQGRITGRFSQEEASDLAIVLRVGALPAPVVVEEERTVGPLLGQDSIKYGVRASVVGALLVFGFVLAYYLLAGVIANIALLLNFLFTLAALAYFHATLTLPGIAGLILTLGMAVDANVLINERIREELKLGRPLRTAINNGYNKAFSAIFDSNLTTIIAAALLFWFGTGPIRGFAITLTMGLVVSMFTAIVVTRTIFEALLALNRLNKLTLIEYIKQPKLDYIKIRYVCYALSLLVIVIGTVAYFGRGQKMYGVDFTGGQVQEYKFDKRLDIESIRQSLNKAGLGDASIQQISGTSEIIVKTAKDTVDQVSKKFTEDFPDNKYQIMRIEHVGPAVGKDLKAKALKSLILSLVAILIYVGFRFKHFNFAAAGVIALLHDVVVAVGFLALTNREMSLTIIAALLTIAGYSINDTIVIYDRIREVMRTMPKVGLRDVINIAVNQTMSRTILTTWCTLLVVLALFFFGGEVLNDFSFCLLVGFISGVYSTVFIASPLILIWEGLKGKKINTAGAK
jgi:SecD/SecF fusion protein